MTPVLKSRDTFDSTLRSARSTVSFRETINLAFDSFRASKTRFLLTMLGMVIGSASIVLVATLGLTGRRFAIDKISSIGPNMIELQYVGGSVAGPDNVQVRDEMTLEDMTTILDEVPGLAYSSPMLEIHDRISMGSGVSKDTMLLGVSPQYKDVRNLVVRSGRFFDDQDALTHAQVAVIVEPLARALYGSDAAAIDHVISVKGIPFTVIGVFRESMQTFGMSEVSDQTILIPYAVARYFTGTDTVKQIFFTVKDNTDVEPDARRMLDIIRTRHRPTSVYNAFTLTQVLAVMGTIATMLTIVLTLASAVTLVVSGVGIMNSMLANVQSRLKEIGIRKALGATGREIRLQFLTEAVFLSLSGGAIGTLIGVALPFSLRFFTDFAIPISPWSAIIALGTSMLVGIIFGTVPAQRAARLDPVSTLKYE
jgi:putative ABC transport system permease protein